MLLAIDVGNTNIVLGLFKEDVLVKDFRIGTKKDRTADEYGILFKTLFLVEKIDESAINDIIISSVVPPMQNMLNELSLKYFKKAPIFIEPGIKTGIQILYDNPKEVGADRIVNAVAAYTKCRRSCIVVDFGTATTFDCISEKGEYLGGVISPGMVISSEALFAKASKLPKVEFAKPPRVIGKNSVNSIQSGIFYGYVGLIDEIVGRIKKEMLTNPFVIATGGLSALIAPETKSIEEVDEYLTLKGLKILYDKNKA